MFAVWTKKKPAKIGAYVSRMGSSSKKIVTGDAGYVLEDVPHFSDYIPDLPVRGALLL